MTAAERAALEANLAKVVWEATVARNTLDRVIVSGTAARLALSLVVSPVPAVGLPLIFPITLTEVPA